MEFGRLEPRGTRGREEGGYACVCPCMQGDTSVHTDRQTAKAIKSNETMSSAQCSPHPSFLPGDPAGGAGSGDPPGAGGLPAGKDFSDTTVEFGRLEPRGTRGREEGGLRMCVPMYARRHISPHRHTDFIDSRTLTVEPGRPLGLLAALL